MDQQRYMELYEKFLLGKTTPEEEEMLSRYSEDFLQDGMWKPEMGEAEEIRMHILTHVNRLIRQAGGARSGRWRWLAAASVVILCSAAGSWFMLKSPEPASYPQRISDNRHPVLPGGRKATLILGNGTRVVLNNVKNGVIIMQGSAQVTKMSNGSVSYNPTGKKKGEMMYNTMSTPRGGTYDLTLADGTKVTLNAESSITYPTSFSGKNRMVSIDGEVYFEVTKKPGQPFIVTAAGTETRVLGTHFDIMAYRDEGVVKTTLFEGAVRFAKDKSAVTLRPGQQALSAARSGSITVQDANMEEALAWKNGYFLFQDEDIRSIMRKIARWYDVDVVYERMDTGNLTFGGSVSRYQNIADVLNVLQSTGSVHFKLDERRVTVMK